MFSTLYAAGYRSGHSRPDSEPILTPPVRRSPMRGKYVISAWAVILSSALVAACLATSSAHAYRICTFKGTVVDHGWRSMTVKSNGQCAEVNVGWRTKYLPNRRPCLGERVAVDFILEDGYMKATKVVSLSPIQPSAECYPPAPPSSSTCRTVPGEETPTMTDTCTPPRAICSTKPPAHVSNPLWSPGKAVVPPQPSKKAERKKEAVAKPSKEAPEKKEAVKEPAPTDKEGYKSVTGEVVASSPKSLSLRVVGEGETAELVNIKVGLKTKFIPFRRPAVGEKVSVGYRQENGDKFGYTVKVVQ